MKRPRICRVLPWGLIIIGVTSILIALGAGYLGADADNKWGPFRSGLLLFGIGCIVFLLGKKFIDWLDDRILMHQFTRTGEFPAEEDDVDERYLIGSRVSEEVGVRLARPKRISNLRGTIALMGLILVVELLYVWFVSVGHMTKWPTETNYYGLLAEAFTHGQVDLLIEPNPDMSDLVNPYPTSGRSGVNVISDASYYEGKYYFYWGPVPAVFAAVWTFFTAQQVGDQYIVFIAVSCIFLFSLLILLYLRKIYFPSLPRWLLVSGIILVATAHPILWVLNWPSIYPAAIASGQAFLIAGLFFSLPLIEGRDIQPWRLVVVGCLLTLAFGSRTSLAPAIALLTCAGLVGILSNNKKNKSIIEVVKNMSLLIVPLLIGVILWGTYNLIRFDDMFQTGFRYAMSYNDLPKMLDEGLVFNAIYLLPNLFYYIASPVNIRNQFPIIRPLWKEIPEVSQFLDRFNIPNVYRIEDVSGILFAFPSILLVAYLLWDLVCFYRINPLGEKDNLQTIGFPCTKPQFRRILWVILLSGILAAAPIFFFFWVANRYLLDSVPLFAILATAGAWLLYQNTLHRPLKGPMAKLFIVITILIGLIVGFLLAISGADSRFDDLNPRLFKTLSDLFSLK